MAIDCLTKRGAIRTCRKCDSPIFISDRGMMEMRDDMRSEYPARCSDCGHRFNVSLDTLRGVRDTQLYRITISR